MLATTDTAYREYRRMGSRRRTFQLLQVVRSGQLEWKLQITRLPYVAIRMGARSCWRDCVRIPAEQHCIEAQMRAHKMTLQHQSFQESLLQHCGSRVFDWQVTRRSDSALTVSVRS